MKRREAFAVGLAAVLVLFGALACKGGASKKNC